jgi:ERCC4-related helicase
VRCEEDPELKNYTHKKEIEYVICEEGIASVEVLTRKELSNIMRDVLNKLSPISILNKNVDTLSKMIIDEALKDLDRLHNNNGLNLENYNTYKGYIHQLLILEEFRKDAGNPEITSKLESLQSRISTLSPNLKAIVQNNKFNKVVTLAKKSRLDNTSLQLRQPKVAKLKTILEVHFHKSQKEVSYNYHHFNIIITLITNNNNNNNNNNDNNL